ncbi:hypothetical protein G3I40_33110 [Streptomyces sp. SID14478]|uniref:hypothetical protein n=1 Tax=Streptomyces sp. SID14478 TaxID=2706073 RepID=UPI0013DD2C3A|nr:hypothetical protein [Streptomyces sp. SID14478]NEB80019.1 hypothetical protein [Streptomyces sp. SID14478]
MVSLVDERVSFDQQPADRQNLVLDEADIEKPVVCEEEGRPPAAFTRWSDRSSGTF